MVKPVTFLGIPMIMVRNRGGVINVSECVPSPGHDPCQEKEAARPITCPYHARAYDSDGTAQDSHIGGPNIDTLDSVQYCDIPLISVRSHVMT